MILEYLLVGFGWACIWSFLFLLQQRFDRKNTLSTRAEVLWWRSYDEDTKKTLQRYELIPIVSFLWQKWKSRQGWKKLSYRYVIHELVCAGIAVLGGGFLWWTKLAIWSIVTICILYFLAIYDFRKHLLHSGLWQLLCARSIVWIILTKAWWSSLVFGIIFTTTMLILYRAARRYAKYRYKQEEWLGVWDIWLAGVLGLMIPTLFVFHGITRSSLDASNTVVLFFLGSGIWWLVFALGEYSIKKEQHIAFVPGMAMSFVTLLFFLPFLLRLL